MRLCFLGDDPVVRDHAHRLRERHDVTIVVPGRDEPVAGEMTPDEAERERFALAVAGDWRSSARLYAIPAERYVRHVAQIEHRVLPLSSPDRIPAALALDLPLDFTAESDGLAAFLRMLRPEARVAVVPPPRPETASAPARSPNGRLRVALTGNEDIGRAVLDAMREPHELVDGDPHVVLALGEPREPARTAARAFAQGAALVVEAGPFTDDLVGHRETGLLADPDDVPGTARLLDEAARDGRLAEAFSTATKERLAAWPDAAGSTAALESALESFLAEPPPEGLQWPGRLMGDAIGHAAELKDAIDATHGAVDLANPLQAYVNELEGELKAIRSERAYRAVIGLRARLRGLGRKPPKN